MRLARDLCKPSEVTGTLSSMYQSLSIGPLRACLVLALMIGGCSTVPQPAESFTAPSKQASSTAASLTASAEIGSVIQLPPDNVLGVSRARVLDEYRAASGRLCRRVQIPRNEDSIRVACERSAGQWSFTRALVSSGK